MCAAPRNPCLTYRERHSPPPLTDPRIRARRHPPATAPPPSHRRAAASLSSLVKPPRQVDSAHKGALPIGFTLTLYFYGAAAFDGSVGGRRSEEEEEAEAAAAAAAVEVRRR